MSANPKPNPLASEPAVHPLDQDFDRAGTNSAKWEFVVRDGVRQHWDMTAPDKGDERVLPMWVADMDFRVAEPIVEALQARVAHGVFGYAAPDRDYYSAVIDWMRRRHGWVVEQSSIVTFPGIVPAMNLIVRAFSQPGDRVLIQRPVYHPFTFAVERNGREVVSSSLRLLDGRYEMDFDDLAVKLADPRLKVALLCTPHNPVGRIWSREDLTRFGELCAQHDVLVVADEIHHDLIMPGKRFVPYGSLAVAEATRAIVCTAPSKTFNLAGLHASNVVIADPQVREQFMTKMLATGLPGSDPLGLAAVQAAYRHGEAWLDEVIQYISGNFELLRIALEDRLPQIRLIAPEATYLAWLDCRALGLDDAALAQLFMEQAKIYTNQGHVFGPEGSGFVRLNVACPRPLLRTAIDRLVRVVGR